MARIPLTWPIELTPSERLLQLVGNTTRLQNSFTNAMQSASLAQGTGARFLLQLRFSGLDRAQRLIARAFVAQCRGQARRFLFPAYPGTVPEPVTVSGGAMVRRVSETGRRVSLAAWTPNLLPTTGWTVEAAGQVVIKAGAYLSFDDSVGDRKLCIVAADAKADEDGNAYIQIEPPVAQLAIPGCVVDIDNPSAMFVLQTDKEGISESNPDEDYSLSLAAAQVRWLLIPTLLWGPPGPTLDLGEPPPPEPETLQLWALTSEPPAETLRFKTTKTLYDNGAQAGSYGSQIFSASPEALRTAVVAYWNSRSDPVWEGGWYQTSLDINFSQAYKMTDAAPGSSSDLLVSQNWPSGLADGRTTNTMYAIPVVLHFADTSTKNYRMLVQGFVDVSGFTNTLIPSGNKAWGSDLEFQGANPYRLSRKRSTESEAALGAVAGETAVLLETTIPEGTWPASGPTGTTEGSTRVFDGTLPFPWSTPDWGTVADYTKVF